MSVADVRKDIESKAERALKDELPKLIVELSKRIEIHEKQGEGEIHEKQGGARADATGAEIATGANVELVERYMQFKRVVVDAVEMFNRIKISIQLKVPRIEDGNNFGVGIQEETIGELGRAEDSCLTMLENTTKYFMTRGKLASKLVKYPAVSDYALAVKDLDEKEALSLYFCTVELRNSAAVIHDMISKNAERITRPRGELASHIWH